MKRKVDKLSPSKMGLSDSETLKFLSSVKENNARGKCGRYRMILDCGYYEAKEVNSSTMIFCPQPVEAVLGFQKDLKLLGQSEDVIKK